ncbi:hypothetical protein [Pseudomonas shirazensis]
MKKIFIITFSCFFCFSLSIKAQSVVSDSLEKTVIDYLEKQKKNNYTVNSNFVLAIIYSIPFNKYIVCLKGNNGKLCKESSSSIYKIVTIKNDVNLYLMNNFIAPITLNEENIHFFLNEEECEEAKETIFESIIVMLLIDDKFSIEKEVKGWNFEDLKEDLLCPKTPSSIERSRIRKKYGHL